MYSGVLAMQMEFNVPKLWLMLANFGAASKINYERAPGKGKIGGRKDADVSKLNRDRVKLDCSGYIQYLLYQTTWRNVFISGGTMSQQKYLRANGYREYEKALVKTLYFYEAGKIDDMVRIAFRATDRALKKATSGGGSGQGGVGHVWLTINAMTYECTTKGPNNGPASFPFSVRENDVDAYFVLGPACGISSMGTP